MRLVARLRQPEYTGENRCLSCTVLNLVLVVAVATLGALVTPLVGGVLLAVGVVAIWLRGYAVPYTPTVGPRLAATLPLDAATFTRGDRTTGDLSTPDADGTRVLTTLVDAGVVHDSDDLELDPEFREAWRAAMDDLRDEDLAQAVAAASPRIARAHLHTGERTWVVATDESESVAAETWLPRPVALADVAAVRALGDRGVAPTVAVDAAAPLRLFLDACPDCGGEIVETTTAGCCGGFGPGGPEPVLACASCSQRVATLD